MRKNQRNNYAVTSPADGATWTANNSAKKAWVMMVFLACFLVLLLVMAIAQTIPTVRGGGGSISDADDALEMYRFYTKMNTSATTLPDSMDQAIYSVDKNTQKRSLVFFYRLGQGNRTYPIKDNPGQTVKYLDGWIITPDLCLHDIGSYQLEDHCSYECIGYQWECIWDEQDFTTDAIHKAVFPITVRLRIWQESLGLDGRIILRVISFQTKQYIVSMGEITIDKFANLCYIKE